MGSNETIREFEKRRTERFEAIELRLNDTVEYTNINKLTKKKGTSGEKALKLFAKYSKNLKINNDTAKEVSQKYITLPKAMSKEDFATKIKDLYFDVKESILYTEMENTEKTFKEAFILTGQDKTMDSYRYSKQAVNTLLCDTEQARNKELEQNTFELYKDIISCIGYNVKIAEEIAKENSANNCK